MSESLATVALPSDFCFSTGMGPLLVLISPQVGRVALAHCPVDQHHAADHRHDQAQRRQDDADGKHAAFGLAERLKQLARRRGRAVTAPVGVNGHHAPALRHSGPEVAEHHARERADGHLREVGQRHDRRRAGERAQTIAVDRRAEDHARQHDVDHRAGHAAERLGDIDPAKHLRPHHQSQNAADQTGRQKQLLQRLDQLAKSQTRQKEQRQIPQIANYSTHKNSSPNVVS